MLLSFYCLSIVTAKCDSVCECVLAVMKLLDVKTRNLPRLTSTSRFHRRVSVVMMMLDLSL